MKLRELFILRDIRALALNLTFALMFCSVMFLTYRGFVEAEIISKWYAFIGGSILFSFVVLVLGRQRHITIDWVSILIFTFIGYLFVRIFVIELPQPNILVLLLAAFIILYFSFKQLSRGLEAYNPDILIVGVCLAQAIYGLMQYFDVTYISRGFGITGCFDNPAGFAASLAAGVPYCFSVLQKRERLRYFGLSAFIIIALAVILSESRTGILAITVVSSVYLGNKYYSLFKQYRKALLLVLGVVFIALFIGLFFLKKNSAIGRMLIWETSLQMIVDRPLFGLGTSGFMSEYMLYQADYFTENTDSPYALLADNVTHPFNEYLLIVIEYGVIGLLFVFTILVLLIKFSQQITIPHLCILAIAILACFSYPLRYPAVVILLAYSLANIKIEQRNEFKFNRALKLSWCCLLGGICIFLIRDIRFEIQWGKLALYREYLESDTISESYADLYVRWNGDPMFLYNYGAVLNHLGNYSRSNEIMFRCIKYFNDYDVQRLIADNYDNMKKCEQAEEHYLIANKMIPSRFMPLYRLLKLYDKNGKTNDALYMAKTIVDMPIKVQSGTVHKIKTEAHAFLSKAR